jgi:hypothetical protein
LTHLSSGLVPNTRTTKEGLTVKKLIAAALASMLLGALVVPGVPAPTAGHGDGGAVGSTGHGDGIVLRVAGHGDGGAVG